MRRLPLRSPPRMRGKAPADTIRTQFIGITPAYAGKSQRTAFPVAGGQDHPRVCGEKEARAWPKEQVWGSPPRMRGKVAIPDDAPRFERITPAYAGKSRSQGSHTAPPGDHPRVCGEKLSISSAHISQTGSPPRVRGKGETACEVVVKFGITPAYAGKRACTTTAIIQPKDHPRVCGEKGRAGGAGSWSWSELRWLLTRFPVKVIDTV